MKLIIQKGRTSLLVDIFIQDSSSATGAGLTGLVFNTSSLVCYRARTDDGNSGGVSITLATATRGSWASGGFVEKDATNMPGVYEFGIPNTALASGSETVVIMFKGATNMAPCLLEVQLVAYDPQTASNLGLTSLPTANPGAASGLFIAGTNAPVTITGTGDALTISSTGTNGAGIKVSGNGTGDAIKATGGATGNALELVGGGTSGDALKATTTNGHGFEITATGASKHGIIATGGNSGTSDGILAVAGTGGVPIRGDITGNITGNLSGSVGEVTGNVDGNLGGNVTGSVGSVAGNVGGNVVGSVASIAAGGIARASFAAETGMQTIRSNTAVAGAAGTITLDAGASAVDDFYNAAMVFITGGTGAGQVRFIVNYVGSTQVATIEPNWATNPDNTSTFAILPVASSLDDLIENATSLRQMTRGMAAAMLGKSNGLNTTTAVYRDTSDTVDRISATVDAVGDRTSVALDLSPT